MDRAVRYLTLRRPIQIQYLGCGNLSSLGGIKIELVQDRATVPLASMTSSDSPIADEWLFLRQDAASPVREFRIPAGHYQLPLLHRNLT